MEKKKKKPHWLLKLLEDLKQLMGKEQQHRNMLIETRHAIGRRIIEEEQKPYFYEIFESIPEYMKTLSDELGISESELYAYVKLVDKFPDINQLMHSDVREHSWHDIEHNFLYPPKQTERPAPATLPEQLEKMCGLENALASLKHMVMLKRPENLSCDKCPIRGYCTVLMAKLEGVGSPQKD